MTFRTHPAAQQRRCRATPIAMAVSAALLAIANAQAQTAPAAPSDPNTVVVTGYRYAIE